MITALIGIASEPNRKNRMIAEASNVVPIAHGIRSVWLARKSSPIAADPPNWTDAIPGPCGTARRLVTSDVPAGSDDFRGLMASSWTVASRM